MEVIGRQLQRSSKKKRKVGKVTKSLNRGDIKTIWSFWYRTCRKETKRAIWKGPRPVTACHLRILRHLWFRVLGKNSNQHQKTTALTLLRESLRKWQEGDDLRARLLESNPLKDFFTCMYGTTATLLPDVQLTVKQRFFEIVADAETSVLQKNFENDCEDN